MDKLFTPVQEGHDSKNRIVFICQDANGFFVLKPQTGFRSKHWPEKENDELAACYERVCGCGHTHAFYEDWEKPAEGEEYPAPGAVVNLTAKQIAASEKAAEKARLKAEQKEKKDAEKAAKLAAAKAENGTQPKNKKPAAKAAKTK